MSRIRGQVRLLLVCALVCLLGGTRGLTQEPQPVIALQAVVTVNTPEVSLGQAATIQAAPDMAAKLAAISLGSAPVAGSGRTIESGYVKLRLRRYGIDPATVNLQGQRVMVQGPAIAGTTPAGLARHGAASGSPDQPLMVKRNQLVELQIQCGGVVVHTNGRAQSDAANGELVKIWLEDSCLSLIARVTGPAEATCAISRSEP